MVKIDLHGLKYSQIEDMLANKIITQYNLGHKDIEVITGNSERMKILVKKICEEYDFRVDQSWNQNTGSLIISSKKI
ncbi:MAG: hypothetical protein CMC85_02345 [Flavobacteriaceae bacterium]|nr:hypothetical protein [Flavobacteriaceae bacterium]